MPTARLLLAAAVAAGAATLAPAPALAAHSYDSCTGFIDALPATISKQGTWCLRKDLSTNIATGNAITVAANNVTLDCNDFKVGGLAAGMESLAKGVFANSRQNLTVRNCTLRGFNMGIHVEGGEGHLFEDNLIDNSVFMGIYTWATGPLASTVIRRNRIVDTGGHPNRSSTYGISAVRALIEDNQITGVSSVTSTPSPVGISATDSVIRGNRVAAIPNDGSPWGIKATSGSIVERNIVRMYSNVGSVTGISGTVCRDNVVYFATTPYSCAQSANNL